MKTKVFVLTTILAVICLVCSCSSGGGGGHDSANGVAQKIGTVSFEVLTDSVERSISVTNPTIMAGAIYQYTAAANFTSTEFNPPQGTQTAWADLTMTTLNPYKSENLYFAQGSWTFNIRIIKKGSNYVATDATTYTLLYESAATTQYINKGANNVDVEVTRVIDTTSGAKGTLKVNGVTSHKVSSADKMVIKYGAIGDTNLATLDTIDASASGEVTTYTKDIDVTPGVYIMTFAITDENGNEVGVDTRVVEILKGVETKVEGTVQANIWVATSITVKGVKTITCITTSTDNEYTKNTEVPIKVKGYISDSGIATEEVVSYYFCDGIHAPVPFGPYAGSATDERTYNWNTANVAKGNYYITVIASNAAGTLATCVVPPLKITIK